MPFFLGRKKSFIVDTFKTYFGGICTNLCVVVFPLGPESLIDPRHSGHEGLFAGGTRVQVGRHVDENLLQVPRQIRLTLLRQEVDLRVDSADDRLQALLPRPRQSLEQFDVTLQRPTEGGLEQRPQGSSLRQFLTWGSKRTF